ncbi:MAG TPA: efflux RND transporter periplasmic adaptor subunit [Rhizomicrobium sp.]|nr:efflux RND transporter periplasmic adaptor subunit [Rhizomicrobium sp.]
MDDRHVDAPLGLGQRWTVPDTPAWRRYLWILAGLALVLIIVWVMLRVNSGAPRSGRLGVGGPVPVGVSHVMNGDVRVTVNGLGTVTPLATVTLHPQVTGYIVRFDITEGQMVKQGQLLAEIDPRPFQATLDQAKGQLARDEASLANAKIDLARYQALWKQNAVSQQTLQTQIATVGTDQGTVKADQAAVESAAINLGFTRITSPVAGRVGLRQVDPGNLVVSGSTAIIVVTQLQPISVLFSLPEDDIHQVMRHVNAGQTLTATAFDRSMTTKLADGTLSNVDNQVDAATGMVKMRAMFDNADHMLFPEQFVNIRLLVDTLHHQDFVSAAAIQHGAQGTYVYVIDKDRTAHMRTVTTGVTDGDKVAITSGLQPGETVVVDGADRLKEDQSVLLPGDKGAAVPTAGPNSGKGKHGGHHRHRPGGDSGGGQ